MSPTSSQHILVRLPPLFEFFLSGEPRSNPNYQKVRPVQEEVIAKFCHFNAKEAKTISKCNTSYFMAIVVPDAEISRFEVLCDWGNWVFPYDDLFDNGYLRDSTEDGYRMMDALMRPMLEDNAHCKDSEERPRLLAFHDTVWERMQASASEGTLHRFAQAMQDYAEGAVSQIKTSASCTGLDCEKTLQERRKSVAVTPIFALAEYALKLDIPDMVMEHAIIEEIRIVCIDLIALHNDILSYRKEESERVPHNLVASCRRTGMTAQEAFDHMGEMLTSRHLRLSDLLTRLPSWNPETNHQVSKYIDCILNTVRANLYWSYASGRYFGKDGDSIKQTGVIEVQKDPSWTH